MSGHTETTNTDGPDPVEVEARRWLTALEAETGSLELFDAHTHFGRHDPDGFRQEPSELAAIMEFAGARAVTTPMHEPGGYGPANDEARGIEAESRGRIVHFCRVDPRDGALQEAERCLDLGAHGIKLHPRAEQFRMSEPVIERIVALAAEREVPILIHAGRGIPPLGQETVALARHYPGARFILAHAAVSDLAWLWRAMPENPNIFIDSSWFVPADLIMLFGLVPPGQILWASDNPYALPLHSAAFQLRFAVLVGLSRDQIRAIASGNIERILARGGPADLGPAPGTPQVVLDPGMDRVASHLSNATGRLLAGGNPAESFSLARLACDLEGPEAASCRAVLRLLELSDRHQGDVALPGRHLSRGGRFLAAALSVARTPGFALPLEEEGDAGAR